MFMIEGRVNTSKGESPGQHFRVQGEMKKKTEKVKHVGGKARGAGQQLTISELMVLHDLSGNLYNTGLFCSLNSAMQEEFFESPFG